MDVDVEQEDVLISDTNDKNENKETDGEKESDEENGSNFFQDESDVEEKRESVIDETGENTIGDLRQGAPLEMPEKNENGESDDEEGDFKKDSDKKVCNCVHI